MLLAQIADIRTDLGFDDMTDINASIGAALDAADVQLQASLNTDFTIGAYVDTFYIDDARGVGSSVSTELRLSAGLVTSLTSVQSSSVISKFIANQGTDASGTFTLDAAKGILKDIETPWRQTFIRASYTSGFAIDGSNPLSYDLTMVPTWLQEAAKLLAKVLLADSPSLTEAGIKLDTNLLRGQLSLTLARKVRYAPCALLPL